MTDLAGDPLVVGSGPDRFHVSVAEGAFLTPCVCFRELFDGVHRRGSVMTELPEGVGNEEVSRDEEAGAHDGECDEKTRDLLWHAVHPSVRGIEMCWTKESRGRTRAIPTQGNAKMVPGGDS